MEFVKLTDACQGIRGAQLLKELFQPSTRREWDEKLVPQRVWESPGHIYVSLHQGETLISFDVVPQSKRYVDSKAVMDMLRSGRIRPQAGVGSLLYVCSSSPIIEVCFLTEDHSIVYIVHASGEVDVWKFMLPGYFWRKQATCQLASTNATVTSVVLCSSEHCFVWCEERSTEHSSRWLVCVRPLQHDSASSQSHESLWDSVGPATVVVHNCPTVSLYQLKTGVWLMPSQYPAPRNLSLFYSFQSKSLTAFVWQSGHPAVNSTFSSAPDFKLIASKLACVWTKSKSDVDLLALSTHSLTNQLIGVGSDGCLYELHLDDGVPASSSICQLSPFTDLSTDCSSVTNLSPHTNLGIFLELFLFRTFALVSFPGGILRMYVCSSGALLWQSELMSGSDVHIWISHGPSSSLGVWTVNGIHQLQSKPVTSQANVIASGRAVCDEQAMLTQDVTVGTDDARTQNFITAAKYCKLWGLKAWSEKFVLDALRATVQNKTEGQQRVSSELEDLLDLDCLHSPALLLALLTYFPGHRHEVVTKVKDFLVQYTSDNDSHRSLGVHHQAVSEQHSVGSALNDEIVPLLRDYVALYDQVTSLLSHPLLAQQEWFSPALLSVKEQVKEILEKAFVTDEGSSLQDHADDYVRLESLAEDSPCEVLDGIFEFLEIPDIEKAVIDITNGTWQSKHNWRNLLVPEGVVSCGPYQGASTRTGIPLFEMTCRLLYHNRPDCLVSFVKFSQLAREYNAKSESLFARRSREHYFFRRAVDCLPPFVSIDATPVSISASKARVQLMIQSGRSHMEVESLRLYLRCQLWHSALEFAKQFANQNVTHYEMFCAILSAVVEARVLKQFQDQVVSLMPRNFRVHHFMSILNGHISVATSDVMVRQDDDALTVSDLLPFLTKCAES